MKQYLGKSLYLQREDLFNYEKKKMEFLNTSLLNCTNFKTDGERKKISLNKQNFTYKLKAFCKYNPLVSCAYFPRGRNIMTRILKKTLFITENFIQK